MSVSRSGVAQAVGHRDQHRVAERVAEAVVGLLEVIDVDEQQRPRHGVVLAAPVFRTRLFRGDEVLEIAPVVERGQRVAAALHAEFRVLLGEERVGPAQLAIKPRDDDERHREEPGDQPPDPLHQDAIRDLDGLEPVLAIEKIDLPAALFRFVFFLDLEQSPLAGLDRDLVVELSLAVIKGKRSLVVAELFEVACRIPR